MSSLKKPMILFIVCTFILISASCAFAGDTNQTCDTADAGDFEVNLDVEDGHSSADTSGNELVKVGHELKNAANESGNVVEAQCNHEIPATYSDLCHDLENLKDGDVYDIEKDYLIEDCDSALSKNRIIHIGADNLIINGNGHVIDGNLNRGYFAIFNITGKNVTIMNLNIKNVDAYNVDYAVSYWNRYGNDYTRVVSPVEWHGDDGVISNCTFDYTTGIDGGALCLIANNCLIDSCYFNRNFATRGGSVFISGYNNTIRNSTIKDSYSSYYDGIFLKNFDENGEMMELTLENTSFENYRDFIKDFHVEGQGMITCDNRQVYPTIPPGSYNELREIIRNLKDGDVYNLTKDYYFDYNCCYYQIMANNVTINGNGHKIYGNIPAANPLIWVTGNNVNVNNLIFDFNDLDNYGASFVYWIGDNGTLENCTFIGNQVKCGGAIKWKGNDGVIDSCAFINNTALVAAGAIYITGENNRVSNSIFINCYSEWNDDAIFIDYKRKGLTFENILFDNEMGLFDQGSMKCYIDVEGISSQNYIWVGGDSFDISQLIYSSIMKGGIINYSDEISYYSTYYNETGDFIFTIIRDYGQYNITYSQNYYFSNVSNYSYGSIFKKLENKDYESKFTIIKKAYISCGSDYLKLMGDFYKVKSLIPNYDDFKNDVKRSETMAKKDYFTLALDVTFTKSLTINCPNSWDLTTSSFDVLNFNGAKSTIRGSFEDREEEKFVVMNEKNVFAANNLTIEGFNTAIENMGGQCILDHVNFNKNRMDYIIDRDWGAAIINTGTITCVNCSFTNNYAKNGGAIFNQGLLTIQDCSFANNEAYNEGNHICVGDGGKVIYDGKVISSSQQCAFVHIAESMSLAESSIITGLCVGLSFVVGTVVGVLTANPFVGAAVGCALGAVLGTACAGWIISEHFDANFDRTKTILTLVIGSAAAGALGGLAGGFVGSQWAADAAWIAENGGPGEAWVQGMFEWYHYVGGEVLGFVLPGAIVGITYYFTN